MIKIFFSSTETLHGLGTVATPVIVCQKMKTILETKLNEQGKDLDTRAEVKSVIKIGRKGDRDLHHIRREQDMIVTIVITNIINTRNENILQIDQEGKGKSKKSKTPRRNPRMEK